MSQVVAKKLEKMLETTLSQVRKMIMKLFKFSFVQLKVEQRMRKEAQEQVTVLERKVELAEKKVENLQAAMEEREEELEAVLGDKEAKILNLEASVDYLQVRMLAFF